MVTLITPLALASVTLSAGAVADAVLPFDGTCKNFVASLPHMVWLKKIKLFLLMSYSFKPSYFLGLHKPQSLILIIDSVLGLVINNA